ncbi:MAG: Maf family protein [Gammaproteobacteria bacterium]
MNRRAPPLYLASASPRRRALLEQIGVPYGLLTVTVDETPRPGEPPEIYVLRLALDKARAGYARLPAAAAEEAWVLGADTSVAVNHQILGKPRDRAEGLAMLELLSGATHHVYTGVALVGNERAGSRLSVSAVGFRSLSREECEDYWRCGEPAGKAGGYAIQGRGAMFISRLEGSYSGVMGLPLFETAELLRESGLGDLLGTTP